MIETTHRENEKTETTEPADTEQGAAPDVEPRPVERVSVLPIFGLKSPIL